MEIFESLRVSSQFLVFEKPYELDFQKFTFCLALLVTHLPNQYSLIFAK